MNLSSEVKYNEVFYKCISGKRKTSENVVPLLNGAGNMVTQNMEKSEVLDPFFASVFNSKPGLQEHQAPGTTEKVWSEKWFHAWWKRVRTGNTQAHWT